MLAGLFVFQNAHRKNALTNARFTEQYTSVIQKLHGDVDSVQKKISRNGVLTPVVVESVRTPVSALKIVEKDQSLVLQGISWSADKPLVMIDGKLYKEGDQIGGCTVVQILHQEIILRDADGAQKKITLIKEVQP